MALSRAELDIADPDAVEDAVKGYSPDLVVNAAAYTNVDGCETEMDLAYAVNALGPRNLAQTCEGLGCKLLHVSTNYVFDGKADRPYEPFDLPNPISAYGRTKLAGEEYVKHLTRRWYVVRSAGVYGRGHNFVRTMLRVAGERDVLKVKADEFISPTYPATWQRASSRIVEAGRFGLYHLTNAGSCSWYEFTREIFQLASIEVRWSHTRLGVPSPGSPTIQRSSLHFGESRAAPLARGTGGLSGREAVLAASAAENLRGGVEHSSDRKPR